MSFKALECPKCLKVFSQEIRVCRTGHSICISCCKKITACCICKQAITGTRNYMLEKEISKMQSSKRTALLPGFKKCPLCQMVPGCELMSHLVKHVDTYISCVRTFSYTKLFSKPTEEVENDFLIVNWCDIIFKFYIQVQHKAGNVCFAMQLAEERVKTQYVCEVNYTRVRRRDKFVVGVLEATVGGDKIFRKGSITIPKQEFLKAPSNFVEVNVYCDIRAGAVEAVSSVAKPRRSMVTKSKK